MTAEETGDGTAVERRRLDRTERRFWREIWESVPVEVAAEHGVELKAFGPLQTSLATGFPGRTMMNLLLGAAEPGAVADGQLAAAVAWADSRGVDASVPVTPGLPDSEAAEEWLAANGFSPGYAWMKFVRDAHPPRFKVADDIEVIELSGPEQEPFGMIAATGFGLSAWAAAFFADLPGRERWRCYVAQVDGAAQACAAMLVDGAVAELGIAATLEPARGRGCQPALLHRRILDAAAAGCDTLLVETGERVPGRPSASYRNILRAGFKEAYPRPNWQRAR
ncbi:MAG TPA: hypothetical protein VGO13_10890 [Solirubrobacterales bacterium]|jgi:GNAT superfamily N-acetyltransferase|nr:hypothetical protein [Solirubrobacterales bacterium]